MSNVSIGRVVRWLAAAALIAAEFPSGRHGIFRSWSIDNAFAPHTRQQPTNISVLLDGRPVRTDVYWENTQFKIARIGDPHALVVPGPHVFQIRYSVAGVLDPGTTGDKLTFGSTEGSTGDAPSVFFWKVVPTWNNYIARADISVTLPGFPLQYSPPDGIGPVQNEYIRTKKFSPDALTATLFHLAESGLITLTQVNEKRWTITGIADYAAWDDMDPVSRKVGYALDVSFPGGEFNANGTAAAGTKLATARSEVKAAVEAWALREKLLRTERQPVANWLRWTGVLALPIAIVGFASWGFPTTTWGLPFATFFLFSTPAWRTDAGTRRTDAGRQMWARAEGFHRLIATDSAETRFDFSARKDLYTAYVAFAVAAGIAERWAQKYEAATGTAAPQPGWYQSNSAYSAGDSGAYGGSGFGGFESVVWSSISAYTTAQSSAFSSSGGGYSGGGYSGGGSGGGSSGGGGGGGGGGSW